MFFLDRTDAGRQLAHALRRRVTGDVVVVGLPQGGVPVAAEVADALGAPLDVIVVRKLGVPFQPELAMGAVGERGVRVINDSVVRQLGLGAAEIGAVEERERRELDRRARRLRGVREAVPLAGRTVVIVDDGIATGSTARAACRVARAQGADTIVLAAPVVPGDLIPDLYADADDVVCVHETGAGYAAVGQAYADFAPTSEDDVVALLDRAARRIGSPRQDPPADPPGRDEEVLLPAGEVRLAGHLTVPAGAPGVVIFAHGSGSSRHSPRNRHVAKRLNERGLGTLLVDLLTEQEERDRSCVFDIELMALRLRDAARWLRSLADIPHAVGFFGASTGAAAALYAASTSGLDVAAIVSRGGRPDLAGDALPLVNTPTLLIVGGRDEAVLRLNRQARTRLRCAQRLAVVPGATHLFDEPGALDAVADLAGEWFASSFSHAASAA